MGPSVFLGEVCQGFIQPTDEEVNLFGFLSDGGRCVHVGLSRCGAVRIETRQTDACHDLSRLTLMLLHGGGDYDAEDLKKM